MSKDFFLNDRVRRDIGSSLLYPHLEIRVRFRCISFQISNRCSVDQFTGQRQLRRFFFQQPTGNRQSFPGTVTAPGHRSDPFRKIHFFSKKNYRIRNVHCRIEHMDRLRLCVRHKRTLASRRNRNNRYTHLVILIVVKSGGIDHTVFRHRRSRPGSGLLPRRNGISTSHGSACRSHSEHQIHIRISDSVRRIGISADLILQPSGKQRLRCFFCLISQIDRRVLWGKFILKRNIHMGQRKRLHLIAIFINSRRFLPIGFHLISADEAGCRHR